MASKPKYDLRASDRKRNLAIQIGLTAIVVIFAVALVAYIVLSADEKPTAGEAESIRVTSGQLIKKEGTDEPKAVLSLYEDFLCPACGNFEKQFGNTINKLIDSGAVAADYYMVSILDRQGDGYSTRAANAAYCVAGDSTEAFRRFHAALYAQQPEEGVGPFPDAARLTEVARQAGAGGEVPKCIQEETNADMVSGLAAATNVNSTPTIRINGEDYRPTTPDALIAKIEEIVGNVPALDSGAAPPAADPTPVGPPPNAPAPAP
ncbi:protein-disulfide isomerase [Mycolicibacterium rhodesiae NBB3]|uniref:Protein-disulfide isomerase n=1 Tax=Mycolicibacterium rhodesiae (strain NBB3) TaxID=710685 RepID=G8RPB2_MYCRN|nr:thioredoxin domain-containing protein [Mycolicibacterium rhodesiae]AEV76341.1 protein-disulfide isomerase [Mycolicibacterium rhodesiae NBB3]